MKMNWLERMSGAIDFIEQNLESSLKLEDVAKVACCSKYHFHRMFFACFKVTCAEYIRRRKLTLAAADLMHTESNIAQIALQYGYESPNAFTRAFRHYHGINPSCVRSDNVKLSAFKRLSYSIEKHTGDSMNYRMIDVPEFKIVGKSKRFEFDDFVKEGPKFWKTYVNTEKYKALTELKQGRPSLVTQSSMLSAYFPTQHGQSDEFLDVLGIELDTDTHLNEFEQFTVPAGKYAEFTCTYKTSMKTNRYIYGEWFASTGFERDEDKPDIVSYFPIPFRSMGEMQLRWWIPVIVNS